MSLVQQYNVEYPAWEKKEPKHLELLFPCEDKGWEDGHIVFRIDSDGIGIRDFYRFPRKIGGEIEQVSSSKKGRMTIKNWKSKVQPRYIPRLTKWIENILTNHLNVQYASKYKAWQKERPKDIKIFFTNKLGHRWDLEYWAGRYFTAQNHTDWEQFPWLKIRELRNFLNGKKIDRHERVAEFIDSEENIKKIKRWLEKITK